METVLKNWRLAVIPHAEVLKNGYAFRTPAEILAAGAEVVPAAVPGNFELDLMRAGKLPNLYVGENPLLAQTLEDRHLWYFTDFSTEARPGFDAVLTFEGIDTAAEIFLDGAPLGKTENMFIAHSFPLNVPDGPHSLTVHIIPTEVYTEQAALPAASVALKYNYDQLAIRKAPYMFGWDIMPRIVSAGLWRPVSLRYLPASRLEDAFIYTVSAEDGGEARLQVFARLRTGGVLPKNRFALRVEGVCGESRFASEARFFSSHLSFDVRVENARLWMPKNYGQPNLYDVKLTLLRDGAPCDGKTLRIGIRTVELIRTSRAGENGEFLFRVNGRRIFCLGTNHVPVDAFPSREPEFLPRFLRLAQEIGVNMVRCWGGGYYPCDQFYDFCDAHGILVWQDFAMACGRYPRDARMQALLREETVSVVRRLRSHACLALWSGDNECDQALPPAVRADGRTVTRADPNDNVLTRGVIPAVLAEEDFTRPYLPSSPYLDTAAFAHGDPAEDHLWGPRDFFRGDFYLRAGAHFASEIGYHGCPSPASVREFIPAADLPFYGNGERCENAAWLLHSASAETAPGGAYHYRLPLMYRQVLRLFGAADPDFSRYAMQSQISQAEAFKFFIERFRAEKWRRTGILWWNLIDGWPQVSDAVTDHSGRKKLAFHYIRRSQQPFCLLCGAPEDGALPLTACNDTRETVTAHCRVTALNAGETVFEGTVETPPDETARVALLPDTPGEFYLIEWTAGENSSKNHCAGGLDAGLSLDAYLAQMERAGFRGEFEGFADDAAF